MAFETVISILVRCDNCRTTIRDDEQPDAERVFDDGAEAAEYAEDTGWELTLDESQHPVTMAVLCPKCRPSGDGGAS